MNDEAGLLAAITAHANEDTPRLAYADWLDENEAPVQAEFIRLQCRLASCSAADPDYPDLTERHAEMVAQFGPLAKLTAPALPPGYHAEHDITGFQRGFLSAASGSWRADRRTPTDEDVEQFAAGLSQLIATTTVRELHLTDLTPDQVFRVLTAPGAESLTSVLVAQRFALGSTGDTESELIRAVALSKVVPNLEYLRLFFGSTPPPTAGITQLARAKFDRLTHLTLWIQTGPTCDLTPLTSAAWFRNLRRVYFGDSAVRGSVLVPALAKLPHLESLDLIQQSAPARKALGTARGFPALARLELQGRVPFNDAVRVATGRFPALAELTIRGEGDANTAVQRFCFAKWWPQIRVLELAGGWITDETIKAFARSEIVPGLRVLRLHQRSFGAPGLALLANGSRFPNLTTLNLDLSHATQCRPAVAVTFARRLSLPRLRHLSLYGYPLGDAGAKELAANPHLASVTRLALRGCDIGERGLTALVRSPHLQQLVELDVGNNNLKRAGALLDPIRLPRLSALGLGGNPLTPAARAKLHRARGWLA
ncbi:TIGR02996 domain-containing protein [Gemmata massiliana]|nr:TIGR02996 domain-containing protein [Gemmata massiliana]